MADESIVVEVKDTVDTGISAKLKDIAKDARDAQKGVDSLQKQLNKLNIKPLADFARAELLAADATNKAALAQEALAAAQQRTLASTARTAAAQDKAALSALRLAEAQKRAAERQKVAVDRSKALSETIGRQVTDFNKAGLSVKQYNAAMRGVPAQITDIVVSLQGGQRPLTVLLQQGGQLKDMFGGIRPALTALASGLLALVNPVTVTAAVLGTLFVAWQRGQQELIDFRKELSITGNMAAQTSGDFQALQESLTSVGTKGKAAEALTEIARVGGIATSQMGNVAKAAILMEKATGQAIEDTVAQFKKLADEPTKASIELNKQYNYLTLSVYEQIRALEKQGQVTAAATIAEKAYADALAVRASEVISNAGLMERAWNGLAGAAKRGWDAILDVGRPQSIGDLEKRLATMDKLAKERKASGDSFDPTFEKNFEITRKEIQAQLDTMRESERLSKRQAQGAADYQRTQNEGIAASQAIAKITQDTASKQDQLNKSLKEYRDNLEKIRKVDPNNAALNPDTVAKTEANIREKYKTPKSSEARAAETRASALAKINAQLSNELKLMGMLGPEREKQQMMDRITESLMGRRITLSEAENANIRRKIDEIVEGTYVAAEYNRIYEESVDILRTYNASLLATGDLLRQGKITQEEANKQITLANRRYAEAVDPLYDYNKALKDSTELRKYFGEQLADETKLQQLKNAADAKGLTLSDERIANLREEIRLEREKQALYDAQSGLIAAGPGARKNQSTGIAALGGLAQSGAGGFTKGDAASATNDILKNMGIDTNSFQVALNTQLLAYETYYQQLAELRKENLISEKELSDATLQLQLQQFGAQFKNAQDFFTNLSELQSSKSKTAQKIGKAAAIANTTIATYESATKAYSAMAGIPYVGPALGIAAAAAAVAAGLANVQAIRSQGTGSYAMGGYTGAGSSLEPAGTAHKNEYIFDAASTRRIGVGNLAALRAGSASVGSNSRDVSTSGAVNIVVENNGTPQTYERAPGLTADEVRLIARDVNRKETPGIVAAEVKNPNSQTRKSMSAFTNVTRRESS